MNEVNTTPETSTPAPTAAPAREIVRGRMPVGVVFLARFGKQSGKSTKDKAIAFGTTVGKIDDIAKGRNFAYVTADFRPTAAQKADAAEWLKRVPGGAEELLAELEEIELANDEQAAAFEAVRSASRGQSTTTAAGEPANAGGGNRRTRKPKADNGSSDGAPANPQATAEALLA